MSQNGQIEQAKRERQKERENQIARDGIQAATVDDLESDKADIIEKVQQTDLDEPSKKMLVDNLIAGDWTLTKYDEKDLNEIRWELRILEDFYLALHPASESVVEGQFRQYVYDKQQPKAALRSLDELEQFEVKQLFRGIWSRIKRSDEGFQWENINKSRNESVVINEGDDGGSSGGVLGRLG